MRLSLLFFLPFLACGTQYYVAAAGSDSANGTSPSTPWQTVGHVNAQSFAAGDTISFHGGDTFNGTTLSPALNCTSNSPCVINSYGTGRATISVGSCASPSTIDGIHLTNPQYVTIDNLSIVGPGWTGSGTGITACNGGHGILITSSNIGTGKTEHITVTNSIVTGFYQGVWFDAMASADTLGFDSVIVSGNTIYNNIDAAFLLQGYGTNSGGARNQNTNVTISGNNIHNEPGDPLEGTGGIHKAFAGGCGINIGNTTGLTITGNYVGDIGGYGGAADPFGGTVAIVAANSETITITGNEVARTAGVTRYDMAAIDLDQDTHSAEVAYNLTYYNVGPSIQLGSYGGYTTANSRIHHNISYNDAQGNNSGGTSEQGAIRVWGNTDTTAIFNNTVYISSCTGVCAGVNFEVGSNTNVSVLNNIFKVPGGVSMIHGNQINNPVHIGSPTVLGNLYDSSGGSLLISNDTGSSYTNVTTLAAWRGYGFEILSATDYGVAGASDLTNLAVFSPPANGFIGEGIPISSVGNFNLGPSSVGIGVGINPSLVGVTLGCCDYHGNPALRGSVVDMGANSLVPLPSTTVSGQTSISGQVVVH